jgi:hypothetical protein
MGVRAAKAEVFRRRRREIVNVLYPVNLSIPSIE